MSELKLKPLSTVQPQQVEWLWYPYIPFGKVTILQGDPGEGKTMLMLQLIADLTKGRNLWEQEEPNAPLICIYQTAEDGLADPGAWDFVPDPCKTDRRQRRRAPDSFRSPPLFCGKGYVDADRSRDCMQSHIRRSRGFSRGQ